MTASCERCGASFRSNEFVVVRDGYTRCVHVCSPSRLVEQQVDFRDARYERRPRHLGTKCAGCGKFSGGPTCTYCSRLRRLDRLKRFYRDRAVRRAS